MRVTEGNAHDRRRAYDGGVSTADSRPMVIAQRSWRTKDRLFRNWAIAANLTLAGLLLYRAWSVFTNSAVSPAETWPWAVAQVLLAALIVARPPPVRIDLRPFTIAVTVVSNWYLFVVDMDSTPTYPPWILNIALIVTGVWIAVSLAWLGRSFSIFPAARRSIETGPFRFVRHPVYLGLIVADAFVLAAWPGGRNIPVFVAAVAARVVRIHMEERVLHILPAYEAYRLRVRWRLIPGVY